MSAGSGNDRVDGRFNPGNEVSKTLTVDGAMADNLLCVLLLFKLCCRERVGFATGVFFEAGNHEPYSLGATLDLAGHAMSTPRLGPKQ